MSLGTFDVVIVGGGIMGASVAWHLTAQPGFAGRVLVIERDPSYAQASTSHTNSCIRQQFSTEINVKISRYAAEVIRDFPMACADPAAPQVRLHAFGYLYLAGSAAAAANLRTAQALQASLGAKTRLLDPAKIPEAWPFYALEGVHLGSHGPVDEGYFDGAAMFDHWRRASRARGVTWITGEVTALGLDGGRVTGGGLASGETFACGWLVNAAGPRAARLAAMAGISLPVEPRKRFTWVFSAERPLDRDLPLTIDPSGVHVRSDGAWYMAGCAPHNDGPADPEDFDLDPEICGTTMSGRRSPRGSRPSRRSGSGAPGPGTTPTTRSIRTPSRGRMTGCPISSSPTASPGTACNRLPPSAAVSPNGSPRAAG